MWTRSSIQCLLLKLSSSSYFTTTRETTKTRGTTIVASVYTSTIGKNHQKTKCFSKKPIVPKTFLKMILIPRMA